MLCKILYIIPAMLACILIVAVAAFADPVQFQDTTEARFTYDEPDREFARFPRTIAGVDSLLDLGNELRDRDSRRSFYAAREALALAKTLEYHDGEARAHTLVGSKYLDFGEYEHALEHYILAFRIHESLGNKEGMASLLNNKALVYSEQLNYDKAAEYLHNSIALRESLGQDRQKYNTYNNLGVLYRRQGEFDTALEYLRRVEGISLESTQDSVLYMIATLNIGNTYRNKGSYDLAPPYMEKADAFFEKNGYTSFQSISNLFLGQLYLDQEDYNRALTYGLKSLELSRIENQRERIRDAYELLKGIYQGIENYEEAFLYSQLYHDLNDSLHNHLLNNQLNEMRIRFEVEQKDREISLQEARITQQDQARNFLLTGLGLLLVIIGLLYYNNHQKNKNNRLLSQRRHEIEEQNKELARLNREKDEFLSMAAHDLRNPLSVIMGAVDLLRTEENLEKQEVEEYSQLIEASSDRMMNLINSLLDIKSINKGSNKIKLTKVDVNKALEQSIMHFQHSADVKDITLLTQLDDQAGYIEGDANGLIRVFDNLISNAVKYSPEGTKVVINSQLVNEHVRIAIKDEGPGLTKEDHGKLFGQYVRLSTRPTADETSTGLGLYIVKKITTSMNGRVWCTSKPGEGAIFYVEFPKGSYQLSAFGLQQKHN